MGCLDNFFSLSKGCQTVAPSSGLYIDSLEVISLKGLSNIVGADKLTAQALVNEKTTLVGELLKANPSLMLMGDAVEHSVDSIVCKDFKDQSVAGLDSKRGIRVEKKRGYMTSLVVERFYFKSATEVTNLEITITDGVNSDVHEVTAAANKEVVIEANFHTQNTWVEITYQSVEVEPYIGSLCPYNNFVESDCHGCTGSKSIKVRSIEGENLLIQYRGIKVDASVQCDRDKMICLIAEHQKAAFLYLVGAEILKEWATTDRLNFLAVASKEIAKEKAIEFEAKGNELLFANAQGIKKYLEGKQKECFICNSVKYGYTIP